MLQLTYTPRPQINTISAAGGCNASDRNLCIASVNTGKTTRLLTAANHADSSIHSESIIHSAIN